MVTPKYDRWRSQRVNDNIPIMTQRNAQPIEEHLRVVPSELEIIKQDIEKRSLELGKKIEQLEEEKMQLGLDVEIHKLEAERLRKGKNKAEEDLNGLKMDYKKLRMSIRTTGLGKTSKQWWILVESQSEKERLRARVAEIEKSLHLHLSRNLVIELKASQNKVEELKGRIEELETELQDNKIQVELLEANNEHWKEQLHRSQDQIRDRDYIMGEAVAQVREVADHLQDLAVQLLAGGPDKGKSPVTNPGDDNEEPPYPLGSTQTHTQVQPDAYPQRVPVTFRSQYQTGESAPMNFPTGSGSNLGDHPTNPVVPDLDNLAETDKARVDVSKQLEDRCRWLEEKFKAMENADYHGGANDTYLSLVPDLILLPKFKTPEFEKYNGTSCPEAHISMFCQKMTGYVNNDQLLIHCFQDSLIGFTAKWYNQLSRAQINSWKDLTLAFMKQYGHVTNIAPDNNIAKHGEKAE
ncbi:coiled-coil domain-containing protein 102A-like protein [Gossypium australe]|uniref:Coiled-coil domain-containing protein 102A-like protein n=1 Tax=Gossypium australe TaxID=47621 RepID=A0A5B6V8I9_9ROSI|nr:coiled-coil domain-containing protein 102A-like protein [Gossypium australe]